MVVAPGAVGTRVLLVYRQPEHTHVVNLIQPLSCQRGQTRRSLSICGRRASVRRPDRSTARNSWRWNRPVCTRVPPCSVRALGAGRRLAADLLPVFFPQACSCIRSGCDPVRPAASATTVGAANRSSTADFGSGWSRASSTSRSARPCATARRRSLPHPKLCGGGTCERSDTDVLAVALRVCKPLSSSRIDRVTVGSAPADGTPPSPAGSACSCGRASGSGSAPSHASSCGQKIISSILPPSPPPSCGAPARRHRFHQCPGGCQWLAGWLAGGLDGGWRAIMLLLTAG